ncbi:phosphoglycerate kinase [Patescibacteria group bacterium]|nr:phosphoglycerate kinase [Patescibacteria group bacterium]
MKDNWKHVQQHSIEHVSELKGKKVLLRIDVNVSLGENGVVDAGEDWRILKSYRTINYLVERGASVVLLSHIGRDPHDSLKPVYEYMRQTMNLGFLPTYDVEIIRQAISGMAHGSVLMLENVRQLYQESEDDSSFLDPLVELCDCYVNDAFSVSHRAHASVHDVVRKLPSYFGLQFCDEVNNLSKAFDSESDMVLLLGGAKFGTKLELLQKFLPRVTYALVGGALANVFLRARGINIGKSFVDDTVDISDMVDSEKIVLPIDVVDQHGDIVAVDQIGNDDMMLDIGPETEQLFETIIDTSNLIVWNGPMGKYEDRYISGSVAMADGIAKATAYSIVGGGDTATVILEEGLEENFDFISTGGGAMLEFLVQGTLPGIDNIIEKEA